MPPASKYAVLWVLEPIRSDVVTRTLVKSDAKATQTWRFQPSGPLLRHLDWRLSRPCAKGMNGRRSPSVSCVFPQQMAASSSYPFSGPQLNTELLEALLLLILLVSPSIFVTGQPRSLSLRSAYHHRRGPNISLLKGSAVGY